jgi:hypothetical protein
LDGVSFVVPVFNVAKPAINVSGTDPIATRAIGLWREFARLNVRAEFVDTLDKSDDSVVCAGILGLQFVNVIHGLGSGEVAGLRPVDDDGRRRPLTVFSCTIARCAVDAFQALTGFVGCGASEFTGRERVSL